MMEIVALLLEKKGRVKAYRGDPFSIIILLCGYDTMIYVGFGLSSFFFPHRSPPLHLLYNFI